MSSPDLVWARRFQPENQRALLRHRPTSGVNA